MALIGTIRKNGWILIVALGAALLAFIFQTYAENRSNWSMADANSYGRVDGVSIDRNRFDAYQKNLYGNAQADPYQVRTQVFNHFVEEALVKKIAETNGIGVPREELLDLQFGTTNISPIVSQRFAGENGMVDFKKLAEIKQAIDSRQLPAEYREYWAIQEDEIIQERLQSKYAALLAKGIYTPKWQAELGFSENNQRNSFTYVRIPYDKIQEADVKLTDTDYASYLEKNKEQFWQADETRTIDFVAIDVVPSAADSAATREALLKRTAGWASATNDSLYVISNGGTYNTDYLAKDQLGAMGEALANTPTGSFAGPLVSEGNLTMAKVLARKAVPDSVKARHILIKPGAGGPDAAEKTVDSLLNLIKTGKNTFEALAAQFGTDGTKDKGGDLGWFGPGAMVKEFNDAAFYKLEQGKASKVRTNFGWHVIEVTGKKFSSGQSGMQIAMISEPLAASKATQAEFRTKAEQLANTCRTADQLKEAATAAGLVYSQGAPTRENDSSVGAVATGSEARSIVRWAFKPETKLGAVSKDVFTVVNPQSFADGKYIVATVRAIRPKGYARVDDVRELIKPQVINRKKGEMLVAQIKDASNLSAIAGQFGVTVDTAANAAFVSPSLGPGGFEPKVVGSVFGLAEGQLTKPIIGNSGVFVASGAKSGSPIQAPSDVSMFKRQFNQMASQVNQRIITTMRKKSEIEDFRSRFE